jgi:gluconate kinase
VVGVCSAGKSTLVRNLRTRGLSAVACSQEHSYVPYLWQRSKPDVLVYLDASIHSIRRRGREKWPRYLLDTQQHRLAHARQHCDLYIHTDGLTAQDVLSRVLTFINNQGRRPRTGD